MIKKTGKYYDIINVGQEGHLLGLDEDDLYNLFWDITRVLAPIRGEVEYPEK
jgi:hypothetical protein